MNFKHMVLMSSACVLVANISINASEPKTQRPTRGQIAVKCLLPLGQFSAGVASLTVAYGANRFGNGLGSVAKDIVKAGSKGSSEAGAGAALLFAGIPGLGTVGFKGLAITTFGAGSYLVYRSIRNGQTLIEHSKKKIE